MEIDARGLYFPANEAGEAVAWTPGLTAPVVPNGPGNGNPGIPCALEADDVGRGGENGSWGKCVTDACLLIVDAGEIDGIGGSSSPNETPRARSLASFSSSTYFFQAARYISMVS